jgi:hypothetical protein
LFVLKIEHIGEDACSLDTNVDGLCYAWWELIYKEALIFVGPKSPELLNQKYTCGVLSFID